jgi:hypothetical protein
MKRGETKHLQGTSQLSLLALLSASLALDLQLRVAVVGFWLSNVKFVQSIIVASASSPLFLNHRRVLARRPIINTKDPFPIRSEGLDWTTAQRKETPFPFFSPLDAADHRLQSTSRS